MSQSYGDGKWMEEQWTADDVQYRTIRTKVERLTSDLPALKSYVSSSYEIAKKRTAKQLDLFRWACAALRLAREDWDYSKKLRNDRITQEPFLKFQKLDSPHSYEYARIRFLFIVGFDFPYKQLQPLGERLLSRDSEDAAVIRGLLWTYQPQVREDDWSKGLKLVDRLTKIEANTNSTRGAVAYFYYKMWLKDKSKKVGDQAVSQFELQLSVVTNPDQKRVIEGYIKEIRKGSAE